jgi:protein-disulfide isomerase
MEQNKILMTIGAIIITFILLFGVYKLTNQPVQTDFPEINKIKTDDHIMWSKDKKNILVEYSDFQCPACKEFHTVFRQMETSNNPDLDITKKITLVFRHYPLIQIHNNAENAAYATEAANKQGKFFEMSDLLFNKQTEWENLSDSKSYFTDLAKQLNLNLNQFNKDLNLQSTKDRIQEDLSSGDKAGINSTPTFFLNGKKLDNIQSLDDFKKTLRNL